MTGHLISAVGWALMVAWIYRTRHIQHSWLFAIAIVVIVAGGILEPS